MAIDNAPDVPNFWQTKTRIVQNLYKNDPTLVEPVFIDGLRATKNDIDLITLYASYLGQTGQKQEAIRYWQMAIEKNPDAKSVYESEIANLQ